MHVGLGVTLLFFFPILNDLFFYSIKTIIIIQSEMFFFKVSKSKLLKVIIS